MIRWLASGNSTAAAEVNRLREEETGFVALSDVTLVVSIRGAAAYRLLSFTIVYKQCPELDEPCSPNVRSSPSRLATRRCASSSTTFHPAKCASSPTSSSRLLPSRPPPCWCGASCSGAATSLWATWRTTPTSRHCSLSCATSCPRCGHAPPPGGAQQRQQRVAGLPEIKGGGRPGPCLRRCSMWSAPVYCLRWGRICTASGGTSTGLPQVGLLCTASDHGLRRRCTIWLGREEACSLQLQRHRTACVPPLQSLLSV